MMINKGGMPHERAQIKQRAKKYGQNRLWLSTPSHSHTNPPGMYHG